MLLRAFSSGAVALSGVEAVSNGVPAFRKPESRNAAMTIAIMGAILGTCFLGVSVLAAHLHPYRSAEDPTGIALMAEYIYGGKNVLFWVTQLATFAVLILAANTAYADFPRLSSIIARDGYLPRQLANRGDRLVFSNGIIFLAVLAGLLIVIFKGNISALIPLYAFGVFTGFTLSQAGMVVHHWRLREPHWRASAVVNGVGCVATGVVAIVVVVSKFTEGAWIPAVLIPVLVVVFHTINQHYRSVRAAVAVDPGGYTPPRRTNLVVVLVGSVHRGVIDAVQYARSMAPERLIGLSVVTDNEEQARAARGVGRRRHADPAAHHLVAVSRADAADHRLPRRARAREPRRRRDRGDPRVRDAVEAAVAAQPVGVRAEGPPALPPEHGGDVGPGPRRRPPGGVTLELGGPSAHSGHSPCRSAGVGRWRPWSATMDRHVSHRRQRGPNMAEETNETIDALAWEQRTFPPSDAFKKDALVVDTAMYDAAAADDEGFWASQAARAARLVDRLAHHPRVGAARSPSGSSAAGSTCRTTASTAT